MSDDDTRPIPAGQPAPADGAAPATEPIGGGTGHIRVVSGPVEAAPAPRPPQRVGTVVWGIVIAAVGIGLLSIAWGANLDAELALIVLLGVAGVALLVGSLVGLRRSRTRKPGPA